MTECSDSSKNLISHFDNIEIAAFNKAIDATIYKQSYRGCSFY